MIYFDNAASSGTKPDQVINAVKGALKNLSANPGRAGHSRAVSAARLISRTRETVAEYFNFAPDENVIFTSGCTMALNTAIIGTARRGGAVVTTAMEHNSVLRPLFELQQKGIITLIIVSPNDDGIVTADMIAKALTPETYMIAVTHISNVTGAVNPIAEIGALARRKNVWFLVDGAQSAGHIDIDMTAMNIDLLAVPGHKGLYGPQGVGILLYSPRVRLMPIIYGGTGTNSHNVTQPEDPPEAFESGTLNTPGIAGLYSAVRWSAQNRAHNERIVKSVTEIIYQGLSEISGVTIYSPKDSPSGIVTFDIKNYSSGEVADILNSEYNIAVRGGLHCAPLMHKHLCTQEAGLVRVSTAHDNSAYEAYKLLKAVETIASK